MNRLPYTFILITMTLLLISCGGGDCDLGDLNVTVGDCNCVEDYQLVLDFPHSYDGNDFFQVLVRNNESLGYYRFSDLPLTIDRFPVSELPDDYLKVCVVNDPTCCKEIEWDTPNCAESDCEIRDIVVGVIECQSDSTYVLQLDFIHENTGNDFFDFYVRNNELIGTFSLDQLPLTVQDFPISGNDYDFIRICINDDPHCCVEVEFMSPDCLDGECDIYDLTIDTGDCTSDDTYNLVLDFEYTNATHTNFEVFVRNNVRIGNFPLTSLPLTISDFMTSGNDYDFISVCMSDNADCCEVIEFIPPDCLDGECDIYDLTIDTGDCTSEDTYNLVLDFEYTNATHANFEVFVRNNVRIGNFPLTSLPLTISDFMASGNDYDFIRICMSDNADCCEVIEFMPPDCLDGQCDIYDVVIGVGDCISDSTYVLELDFQVDHPGNDFYELWARHNEYLGYYRIDELPLRLEDFPLSGLDYDYLRICINDVPDCCVEEEFMPPDC